MSIIKKVVDDWDPLNLLFYAPSDEYQVCITVHGNMVDGLFRISTFFINIESNSSDGSFARWRSLYSKGVKRSIS